MQSIRGHDRGRPSTADLSRQEHLRKYGSFLYCVERDTLCVFMDGMWGTGCEREVCIKDDPENRKLQKRIEKNRKKAEEECRKKQLHEKQHPPAPIRDQRNRIKSYTEKEEEEIQRLEDASEAAFRSNNPKLGHQLFNRANIRRRKLKEWKQKKEKTI